MKGMLLLGGLALTLNISAQTALMEEESFATSGWEMSAALSANTFRINPNPATTYFSLDYSSNEPVARVEIRDGGGRKIKTYEKPKPEQFFPIEYPDGSYIVTGYFANGDVYSQRLMVVSL